MHTHTNSAARPHANPCTSSQSKPGLSHKKHKDRFISFPPALTASCWSSSQVFAMQRRLVDYQRAICWNKTWVGGWSLQGQRELVTRSCTKKGQNPRGSSTCSSRAWKTSLPLWNAPESLQSFWLARINTAKQLENSDSTPVSLSSFQFGAPSAHPQQPCIVQLPSKINL